ncbi:glycoside hydrolase family 57 protein [Candidatus Margulisiibacteriota bacterium]
MKNKNLNVAFVWHMHQPFYRDQINNTCSMPWVRLHATKDYYDMLAILDEHPKIKQTFNLVPSLLMQIEEYTENNASDKFLDITRKPARSLNNQDKRFLLDHFFMANEQHMIRPYPHYYHLYQMRQHPKKWSTQNYLDLQVWFNLTWFGYIYKNRDETIKSLIHKGHHFTEKDKKAVIAKQWEIMKAIVPKYKELWHKKQVEITTTPFYHPILPLLCDTSSAKMGLPHNELPGKAFKHPQDAHWQIKEGLNYFEKLFGRRPKGMWPSEGSVSREVAEIIRQNGIEWIATDEDILKHSLGLDGRPNDWGLAAHELFSPWQLQCQDGRLFLVFRDHNLSDTIGFRYSNWDPEAAAHDLVNILHGIHKKMPAKQDPFLVSIILDGENAWEHFPNNGWDFLSRLYEKLSTAPGITATTVSEFIKKYPGQNTLPDLFAGSWIDHNFFVWIGYEKANKAWEYLAETREVLKITSNLFARNRITPGKQLQENIDRAWQEIFIAEGSDWFWWYSDFHSSALDLEFDCQFRQHLQNVYTLLQLDIPDHLTQPLVTMPVQVAWQAPQAFIRPSLCGDASQWQDAGVYTTAFEPAGTMAKVTNSIVKQIFAGQDNNYLYLRLDCDQAESSKSGDLSYAISLDGRYEVWIHANDSGYYSRLLREERSGNKVLLENSMDFNVSGFFEVMIPIANLRLQPDQSTIAIITRVVQGKQVLEQWPANDKIVIEINKD